jgi:prepilin peptidase CpaA
VSGVALLVISPRECALPALWWTASFLFLLVVEDVRNRRIPNWLTVPGAAAGVVLAIATAGWPGAVQAVAGVFTAFVVLIVPFAMRGLGAGDVKALIALGAFWGPVGILGSFPWMLVAGGAIAFVLLSLQGELPAMLRRWATALVTWRVTRRWIYAAPAPGERRGLPFALAIALGASAYQFWGPLWS